MLVLAHLCVDLLPRKSETIMFHKAPFVKEQSRGGFSNLQTIVLQLEKILEASPAEHLYLSRSHQDNETEILPYGKIDYRVTN